MSILPLFAAVLASVLLGVIWYSPQVMGTIWMEAAGIKKEKPHHEQRSMFLPILSSVISALLVAAVLQRAQVGFQQMTTVVLMLWLVFCVALRLPNYMFEGRSLKLYLIYVGHDLLNLLVIGSIVSLWK